MMLLGILNYVRVYGPWSLNIAAGGTSDLKVPDLRLWKGTGIIGRVTTDTVARDILASKLPAVLFNPGDTYLAPSHPISRYSRTHCDSPAIGTLAAEYYLGKAFEHFAFVGDVAGSNWSRWRQEAFAARLVTAGKPCHTYPLPPKKSSGWETERVRLCAWLKKLPKPVALFAANDNRARQVLDACLIGGLTIRVSDVASHLGVTCRWAELRFQQSLGRSIHDTIQHARMTTVCAMLKETRLAFSEISRRCGFAQPNHLCTIFKQQFGMTMSEYRHDGNKG
jgi:AraC-like DNA-binding protein